MRSLFLIAFLSRLITSAISQSLSYSSNLTYVNDTLGQLPRLNNIPDYFHVQIKCTQRKAFEQSAFWTTMLQVIANQSRLDTDTNFENGKTWKDGPLWFGVVSLPESFVPVKSSHLIWTMQLLTQWIYHSGLYIEHYGELWVRKHEGGWTPLGSFYLGPPDQAQPDISQRLRNIIKDIPETIHDSLLNQSSLEQSAPPEAPMPNLSATVDIDNSLRVAWTEVPSEAIEIASGSYTFINLFARIAFITDTVLPTWEYIDAETQLRWSYRQYGRQRVFTKALMYTTAYHFWRRFNDGDEQKSPNFKITAALVTKRSPAVSARVEFVKIGEAGPADNMSSDNTVVTEY